MDVRELMDAARRGLAGIPQERLGVLVRPRPILGIPRAARVTPHGSAWHLGALLLGDDALYATGEVVRAREEVRRGFTSESQRARAALAGAARRGGFAEGEIVHVGWGSIDLDALLRGEASGPVSMVDGIPEIRWSPAGGRVRLEVYLDERIELLRHPPAGAT